MSVLGLPLRLMAEPIVVSTSGNVEITIPVVSYLTRHLVIILSGLSTANQRSVMVRFNGDTGGNYNSQILDGAGSVVSAAFASGATSGKWGIISAAANQYGGGVLVIPHYKGSATNKSYAAMGGDVENLVRMGGGTWLNSDPITSITLLLSGDSIAAGTIVTVCSVDERCKIGEVILSGGDGPIAFSNLPAVDGDGEIVGVGLLRSDRVSGGDALLQTVNGDTTTGNYFTQLMYGNGSGTVAQALNTRQILASIAASTTAAGIYAAIVHSVAQFARGVNDPHLIAMGGNAVGSNTFLTVSSSRWNNIAPVTSMGWNPNAGTDFVDGSMMGLYLMPKRRVDRFVATGNVADFTFTPSTLEEVLQYALYGRTDRAAAASEGIRQELNGVTTDALYDVQRLEGDGSSISASQSAASPALISLPATSAGADIFGGGHAMITAPTKADRHKHTLAIHGPAEDTVGIYSQRAEQTAPVTSVRMVPATGANFIAGTVAEQSGLPTTDVSDRTRKEKTIA